MLKTAPSSIKKKKVQNDGERPAEACFCLRVDHLTEWWTVTQSLISPGISAFSILALYDQAFGYWPWGENCALCVCAFIKGGEGVSVWQVIKSQRDVLPHFNEVNIATAGKTRGPHCPTWSERKIFNPNINRLSILPHIAQMAGYITLQTAQKIMGSSLCWIRSICRPAASAKIVFQAWFSIPLRILQKRCTGAWAWSHLYCTN